jgi:hypothetical protein
MAARLSASHNTGFNLFSMIVERARRAADYSRLAGLQRRYLDDAGLTPAEFDAAIDGMVAYDRAGTTASLAHSV